jgi:methyl-accepting chemotaxis protein
VEIQAVLSRLSLTRRFLLLGVMGVMLTLAGVGMALKRSYDLALDGKELEVKHLVEAGAGIIQGYIDRMKKGELSEAEAKALAVDAIKNARFDGGNFLFVNDWSGVAIVSQPWSIVGKNRFDLKDAKGNLFIQEIIEASKTPGGAFASYWYPKPGETEPSRKISYSIGFPEWQWALGTGLYVDSVDVAFLGATYQLAIVFIPLLLIFAGLIIFMNKGVSRLLRDLADSMQKIAAGDLAAPILGEGRADEIGEMAKVVASFRQGALEKLRLEGDAQRERASAEEVRGQREEESIRSVAQNALVVNELARALTRLSEGDLTSQINAAFASEYEKIRIDFNKAVQQLRETMRVIADNARNIHGGSSEIAQAADDLSRRTEQQAAGLEETAAAIGEIVDTVTKTAEGAHLARDIVAKAKSNAEHSEAVVKQAVAAMANIEDSSRKIGQIIGVIDEIAFQTNLLALNAGVEAARAGDAGRGFAVVASEVRGLAQRSAEAAKEIKSLINASTAQVEQGVELVGQTGRSLDQIAAQVAEINSVINKIAASAQEQATGLKQVNVAIDQMDKTTQQNAAMVEESTAASHALAGEADTLASLISRFQLGAGSAAGADAPGKRPAGPARTAAGGRRIAG